MGAQPSRSPRSYRRLNCEAPGWEAQGLCFSSRRRRCTSAERKVTVQRPYSKLAVPAARRNPPPFLALVADHIRGAPDLRDTLTSLLRDEFADAERRTRRFASDSRSYDVEQLKAVA